MCTLYLIVFSLLCPVIFAFQGNPEAVFILLNAGLNPKQKDAFGQVIKGLLVVLFCKEGFGGGIRLLVRQFLCLERTERRACVFKIRLFIRSQWLVFFVRADAPSFSLHQR